MIIVFHDIFTVLKQRLKFWLKSERSEQLLMLGNKFCHFCYNPDEIVMQSGDVIVIVAQW